MDLTIVIPSSRPHTLAHVLNNIRQQKTDGIEFEVILVQEATDFGQYGTLRYESNFRIHRQNPNADNGASARDFGALAAKGKYVAFWDDDNVYYPHAIASVLCTTLGHDVGIVRIRHQGLIIPSGTKFKAGDIDSMCLCVRKELATRVQWADNGGRFNDYRWITKVASLTNKINFSPVIIGEHV